MQSPLTNSEGKGVSSKELGDNRSQSQVAQSEGKRVNFNTVLAQVSYPTAGSQA